MTDYIKREDAIEAACMGCNDDFSNEPCEPSDCDITRKIMELPSADVVEVVRCKDCKHRQKDVGMGDHRWCYIVNGSRCSDDFCSYGWREEA